MRKQEREILQGLDEEIIRQEWLAKRTMHVKPKPPSYHDLYVTTKDIPRTRLFDLPYDYWVVCTRVSGWEVWSTQLSWPDWKLMAGEYAGPDKWLVLDVNGTVIVDSRRTEANE